MPRPTTNDALRKLAEAQSLLIGVAKGLDYRGYALRSRRLRLHDVEGAEL